MERLTFLDGRQGQSSVQFPDTFKGMLYSSLYLRYLSGRYQKVCVDGKLSEPLGIHSGVPQGSILGPALFLLFINDLPLVLKNNIGIYADDSTLYASAPTLAEVEQKIRPDIDAVSMWRTGPMRRTFFYSTINELNALNLEPTTSFSLMKTTLTNNAASNYTVDNFKVKKLF